MQHSLYKYGPRSVPLLLHLLLSAHIMLKISLLLCSVPAVLSIIVTDPPPALTDYKYSYDIEDPSTGDTKSQHEVRKGDVVSGAYSVVGPDGTKRIVEYTADSKHGFKAVVREEPAADVREPAPTPESMLNTLKPVVSPVEYTLVEARLPYPYIKGNRDIVFFTPANEIKSERVVFEHGKYFEPALK